MTKNTAPTILILTFFLSLAIAGIILLGLPADYYAGLFLVVVLLALFLGKPLYFLLFLFFVRALLDNYLFAIRFIIAGIDIGLGGIFSLFLIVGTVLYVLTHSQNLGRLKHGVVMLSFLFCLMSVGSAMMTVDVTGTIKELIPRFSIFSVLIVVLLTIQDERQARLVLKTIVLSAVVPVLVGFVKYLAEPGRFQGTFSHPNVTAFYLLIILGCLAAQVHREEDKKLSFLDFSYFALLLTAFLLTLTRSAWASFCLMGGIYALFFKRKWIAPAFILLLVLGSIPVVQERVTEIFTIRQGVLTVSQDTSFGWRLKTWAPLWSAAIQKPILGYGINATARLGLGYEAHNDFLRFFVESGIIGLIIYFGFYAYTFIHLLKNYKFYNKGSVLGKTALFLMCFIPAFILMSISENLARYTTIHWYIVGIIGVYFGLYGLSQQNAVSR